MATMTATRRTRLRRDPEQRLLGGVCAGIARELRVDPIVVRVAFVAAAAAGGIGVVVYLAAWALTPVAGGRAAPARRLRTGRGDLHGVLGLRVVGVSGRRRCLLGIRRARLTVGQCGAHRGHGHTDARGRNDEQPPGPRTAARPRPGSGTFRLDGVHQ